MPEVLEDEPQQAERKPFVPPFTNPEFARLAGMKSGEMAKAKAQELANLRTILATTQVLPPDPQADLPAVVQLEVAQQLNLTEEQIAYTRAELNRMNEADYGFCKECKRHGADGKERAALLREMRGLMELRLRLRGIGEPGRLRPVNEPARSGRVRLQPIEPACVPNTPTGCSHERQPTEPAPQDAQEPNG